VEWYWQGNGTDRGMVLAGEWYWQGNGTSRGMVLAGEWYWQGKTDLLGEKHYIVWVVGD